MTTKALKLARRAINNLISSSHLKDPQPWRDARQDSVDALTAIEEALQSNEQVEPARSEAYDMVDRFLRNSMHDEGYADYSKALDLIYTHPPVPTAQPKEPEPEQEPVAVYGYCPECGAKGVMRERRLNGNDKCASGHTYPSREAATLPQPKEQKQEPVKWIPIEQPYPQTKSIDILMGDGSILCAVLPQFNGDLWWEGSGTGEKFIDPKYANVTHWRIHGETTTPPQRKPWVSLSEEDREQHRDSWRSNIHDQEIKAIEAKLRELNEAPQLKPLTDEELDLILQRSPIQANYGDLVALSRDIEAAHNIKE